MMTPDPQEQVLEGVCQMLARAKPQQTKQLLSDIMNSARAAKESTKYDA